MEVRWLGYSCFELTGKKARIITDPYSEEIGYQFPLLEAGIVTVSHHHCGHDNSRAVGGNPKIIDKAGEYEISDTFIAGLDSYHDNNSGKTRGRNIIYTIEADGLVICHLGDLGHTLNDRQMEYLGGIDILFVPVGGVTTLDAAGATQIIRQLEPRIVIPMHYLTQGLKRELDSVDRFLKEIGSGEIRPRPKLNISKTGLPESTEVVLLERVASR